MITGYRVKTPAELAGINHIEGNNKCELIIQNASLIQSKDNHKKIMAKRKVVGELTIETPYVLYEWQGSDLVASFHFPMRNYSEVILTSEREDQKREEPN